MTNPDDIREAQARLFVYLADRLRSGDTPVPLDILAPLVDELEQRVDESAVASAWEEEGRDAPQGEDFSHPSSRTVPVGQHEVVYLKRAQRDLQSLESSERVEVAKALVALAHDPVPRGARGLHGRAKNHVQHRVGQRRLLYCIHERVITVVALTEGPP